MRNGFYNRMITAFVVSLLMALPMVGCDKTPEEPQTPEVKEFKIEINGLTSFELNFTITPPEATPTYTVKVMPNNKSLDVSDIELAASIVASEDFTTYNGKQTITFGGLVGNSSYRLIYFAYDVENKKMLSDLYRSDVINTPESEDAGKFDVFGPREAVSADPLNIN